MKRIPLTQEKFALVDDEDYEALSRHNWYLSNKGYATRTVTLPGGERHELGMHRAIMGLGKGDRREVDHRNVDTLDNQRGNLRICKRGQNTRNVRTHRDNACGLKGVWQDKRRGTWHASIMVEHKKRYLGKFETPELAHEFYCLAADMLHGEFARHA
jgi:hypothetical protein